MKVLFITAQPLASAGSEDLWVETASELSRRGHDVSAVMPREWLGAQHAAEIKSAGIRAHKIPMAANALDRIVSRTPIRAIADRLISLSSLHKTLRLEGSATDVIVVTQGGLFDAALIPSLINFFMHTHIPFIVNVRSGRGLLGGVSSEERQKSRALFARAAGIVVPTLANADDLERELCFRAGNITAIHSPVKNWHAPPASWPPGKTVRFASPCRIEAVEKGLDLLVEAASRLSSHEIPFEISIYGSGPDADYLRQLIAYHGMEHRIFLRGRYGSLEKLWREHHVLLVPSRSEGMPQSLMEAMAAGRPAVATCVGGVQELLVDGKSGFLALEPTVAALTQALRRCLESHVELEEMGRVAAATARERLHLQPELEFAEFIAFVVNQTTAA